VAAGSAADPFAGSFSLALGGGGARGWAHLGVARALEEEGLRPARVVGTSMGSIVGAAIAAGVSTHHVERMGRQVPVYRLVRRRTRLALFDPRPVLELLARELGDPRMEELPIPLAVTSLDLTTGRPAVITSGRLVDAIGRSIAVPGFFPPVLDGAGGVWCDAGPWEAVPVTAARALSDDPVVGVYVDSPKPRILESAVSVRALGWAGSRLERLGAQPVAGGELSLRAYLWLLSRRLCEPVVRELPDLLITPALGFTPAWQFSRVGPMVARGYAAARRALDARGTPLELVRAG
jgi:predicted acylesterase/phospholipase RssA